jgi:hypothetical protein
MAMPDLWLFCLEGLGKQFKGSGDQVLEDVVASHVLLHSNRNKAGRCSSHFSPYTPCSLVQVFVSRSPMYTAEEFLSSLLKLFGDVVFLVILGSAGSMG